MGPQATLIIREPGQPVREVSLDGPSLNIGRRPDNDIVLSLGFVSGYHGRLERRGDVWHYVDLGSTNGSYVNGQLVQSAEIADGDILRVGDPHGNSVSLTFQLGAEADVPVAAFGTVHMKTTSLERQPSLFIGRDPQVDIHLPAPLVSRRHACLHYTSAGHVLADLGSTNGTFVNGQRLSDPQLLQEGDVVQIGPFTLVYGPEGLRQYTSTNGVRLDGLHLVREVGRGAQRKRILQDVNISIYPREFVSLVGTSGAGKSTLMMSLNGFARAAGQVLVNGDDLYRHFDLYRTMVGYVPQDDIIHRDLTVASALRYAARLRLPPDTLAQEIEERIDQVLEQVEMIGQKHQIVSSLSGGQRKRVSIAVELLAEPNLFFLDEPTSGLDPGLEKKMMHTLRRLADGGRTIVLVTHATANILQCDHVCFLSQGRVVYFGPSEEALSFFGVTSGDFADIYNQLDDPDPQVARQRAAEWEEKFKTSVYYQQYVIDRHRALPQVQQAESQVARQRGPKVSMLRQFFVLTRRYLDLVLRDKLLLTVLMAVMPIIGALVLLVADANWLVGNPLPEIERQLAADLAAGENSATYSVVGSSQTLLFIMALASVLLGLFASVYEIVKEWSVYQRERMVTLRILPYIASKVVVLGVFALIQCLLLMLVISLKVDYPRHGVLLPALLEIYVTLVLGTLVAVLMGLLISAIVPNANTVIYLVFLVLFFQMIFAGVLFELPGITNQFSNLTLTRWVMEGLGSSANMEWLNTLTRTRFQPESVTEEVSMEVERPDEDWEPVTVVTTTQEMTVAVPLSLTHTVPLSVPHVSVVTTTQAIVVPVQPGLTQTVPISVPQVSAVTTTREITVPIQQSITHTVPLSVPEVTVNEMVTVTETMTETFTAEPDPMDVYSEQDFHIHYSRTLGHLLLDWTVLIGFGLAFASVTAIVLRKKDIG